MEKEETVTGSGPSVGRAIDFLSRLLEGYRGAPFAVRLWEGTRWSPTAGEKPRFTLALQHPGALRRMFRRASELTLGEAYIFDDFDVEGDIEAGVTLADHLFALRPSLREQLRLALYLLLLPDRGRSGKSREARLHGTRHSKRRDRRAVTYHYDVSNDFYRLWLDERMVYSCAYFADPAESLDAAQERKLDYLCRKLRLRPGERLLDIGCGWGGLIRHAARHYGVEAVGITLSRPQAELANERSAAAGLAGSCRAEVRDYREMDEAEGFDKIVSVGMFEHVGKKRLAEYFARAHRLLRPGGVFLNHGIAVSLATPFPDDGPSFIDRYVFPDGELLSIATTLRTAEACGFEVRDVENLREHYALTLRRWVRRLEERHREAAAMTDEVTYRIWRIYMAGSAHGFATGRLNLYQALLAKPVAGDSRLPLTRADWYA